MHSESKNLLKVLDKEHFKDVSPESAAYKEAKAIVDAHDKVMDKILAISKRIERIDQLTSTNYILL